jgi:F-type H+-transporting ATPase subunit b
VEWKLESGVDEFRSTFCGSFDLDLFSVSVMLSRALLSRAVPVLRPAALASRTAATVAPAESSERDLVNFPRRKRPIEKAPVRLGFIPEEWFTALYNKTGITGPYMFMASFGTYLLSKEIYVLEHEFYAGLSLFAVWGYGVHKLGPDYTKSINEKLDAEEASLKAIRQDEIDRCLKAIKDEENSQWMASSYEQLIAAKKESVSLQLEAAYRERINDAYQQVKKRLDYQLELANVMRRMEQKHMVDWIMGNVRKSITAKQEADALKKCIADLKGMVV